MSVCTDYKSRKAAPRWEREVLSEGGGKGTWAVKAGKERLGGRGEGMGREDQPKHILFENDKLKPNILYDYKKKKRFVDSPSILGPCRFSLGDFICLIGISFLYLSLEVSVRILVPQLLLNTLIL